jgi:hypothetical protein
MACGRRVLAGDFWPAQELFLSGRAEGTLSRRKGKDRGSRALSVPVLTWLLRVLSIPS